MFTDIFLALKHEKNRRGNPILAALLYSFCPAAAHWWLAGADVEIVHDVTWQAITDYARGMAEKITLKDMLANEYSVDAQTDEKLKEYFHLIKEWRKKFLGLAPELSVMFPLQTNFAPDAKFGESGLYERFGGSWRYMYEYVRVWSILMYDWYRATIEKTGTLGVDSTFDFKQLDIVLSAPGVRRPAYFPAWAWIQTVGMTKRTFIGLLVNFPGMSKHPQVVRDKLQSMQDQLRFALVQRSALAGDEPWPNPPEVYALDRATGAATPFDPAASTSQLLKLVTGYSEAARSGFLPPTGMLQGQENCDVCGFRKCCYPNGGKTIPDGVFEMLQKPLKYTPADDEA